MATDTPSLREASTLSEEEIRALADPVAREFSSAVNWGDGWGDACRSVDAAIREALRLQRERIVAELRKCVEYSGYKTRTALVELIGRLEREGEGR